ncbi:MAG: GAF domain-containing protein [Planctomycetaceae bacterium]|nr:GAF domain-containing protein [Planctomycetaceae bacterium]
MLQITLTNQRQRRQITHEGSPLEFGRLPKANCDNQIVVDDPYTSREQVRLEELDSGDVRVVNLGSPIILPDGSKLPSGQTMNLIVPARIAFGMTSLDLSVVPKDPFTASMHSIDPPSRSGTLVTTADNLAAEAPSAERLARWFEALLGVQRAAAGSQEFYSDTARAVVQLVGLDRGMVLLKRADDWETVASHSHKRGDTRQFSRRVLAEAEAQQRTYYQQFRDDSHAMSLANIEAVVASPIFNERGNVVGAVYGSRDVSPDHAARGILPLEAQFVQLLAAAVSTGLARVAQEAEAARARVQFEQFFSPELAGALQRDRGILAAQERELTLLFADLRGFSRVAERIGAAETYKLLSDILDRLTNQVMDYGGVVIDYYGDGLAAMWNAPTDQPQHADLAAEAALAMLGELPKLNEAWEEKLGTRIRLGIGLHTGTAQVGNSGSQRRLKYGPRGHAVNLASRVEAATKVLRAACLLTASTQSALTIAVPRRRVCRAQLSGMADPVDLFELPAAGDETWPARCERYEQALRCWEAERADECLAICRAMQAEYGTGDGAVEWLAGKAQERVADSSTAFLRVFAVETK